MIKFFRKIRQSLLTENKFRKYLIYAIGEIVLVVIGILIALQINNYNQERIIKEQNQIILQNLNKEFKENLIELDVSIDRLNSVIEGLDRLLLLMRTQDSNMTNLEFDQLLNKTFWMPNWKPSSFVLVELKNSGALSNLNNNNLKSLLFKWEREFDQMENNNANFKQYGAEYIEFIHYGLNKRLLKNAGFIKLNEKKLIMPIYFQPFINENIDIYFFSSKNQKLKLFMGDGDQDRPN